MHKGDCSHQSRRFAQWYDSNESGSVRSRVFVSGVGNLRYRDLFENVRRLAAFFGGSGLGSGSRIVIASDDDISVATLFIAALRCGLTAVVLDPQASPAQLGRLIAFSDAAMHFLDAEIVDRMQQAAALPHAGSVVRVSPMTRTTGLKKYLRRRTPADRQGNFPALLDAFNPVASLPDLPEPDQTAYILFTSGTTSTPKGVEIAHRSLDKQLSVFFDQYSLGSDSRLLNLLPLHHADGLVQGMALALAAGATIVRPFRFSITAIPDLLDAVYHHRITHFITVPSVLALIREYGTDFTDAFRTEDFRFVVSTAAYLDEKLWRSIEEIFGVMVVNVYGLTETVCEAMYCGPDPDTRALGTVGKPLGCEARIVDEEGHDVTPGAAGELLIRGDIVMKGYFRQPDATAHVLRNGWLHTGDIACYDSSGHCRIVGRKKSLVIVGGLNVYPEEIASVLMSMPGVRDAVVFGVEDKTWGEIPVACIVPTEGRTLDAGDVREFFLARASQASVPRRIHFFDELPRGPSGKVLLQELRKFIAADLGRKAIAEDLTGRVLDIAAGAFGMKRADLSPNATSDEVQQWDSLAHVEFLFSLEKEFALRLTPQEVFNIRSIADAVAIICARDGQDS